MSETIPSNDDLIMLQRQITESLQKRVLELLNVPFPDGNYRRDLESVGFSVELLGRFKYLAKNAEDDSSEPIPLRNYY